MSTWQRSKDGELLALEEKIRELYVERSKLLTKRRLKKLDEDGAKKLAAYDKAIDDLEATKKKLETS